MTIEQLLQKEVGKENRTGGFELTIKKHPSKMVEIGKKWLQPVVFIDETGEIPGEILMAKRITLQKNWKIHITVCWLQNGEQGKKLYVEQWWLPTMSMAEYEAKQFDIQQDMRYGEPINIVRGKCRMHEVLKFRETNGFEDDIPEPVMAIIENDIDYILKDITGVTGE